MSHGEYNLVLSCHVKLTDFIKKVVSISAPVCTITSDNLSVSHDTKHQLDSEGTTVDTK